MEARCIKHPFEPGEAKCRHCGMDFCNECLVYSFGPNKPPFCVPCALAAAGVRSNAARPAASRRQMRRLEKEQRKAAKVAKKQQAEPVVTVAEDSAPPAAGDDPFAWADAYDTGERVPF